MKKLFILFLTTVMFMTLVACSSNDEGSEKVDIKSDIDTSYLLGEWYDIKTAQRLIFNSDLSLGHHQDRTSSAMPGYWSIDNNTLNVESCATIGSLTIQDFNNSVSLNDDKYTFVKWESLPITELSVGEAGKDEYVAINFKDINFFNDLPDDIINSVTYRSNGNLTGINSGNVYMKISFDVTNLSKSEIYVPGIHGNMDIIIDYNDGFRYATYDNGYYFYVSDSDIYITQPHGASGNEIAVQPLQTKTFDVYIECPEIISTDDSSPLNIYFISKYGTEAKYYNYSIR